MEKITPNDLESKLETCMVIEDIKVRWLAMAGIANLVAFTVSAGAPPAF